MKVECQGMIWGQRGRGVAGASKRVETAVRLIPPRVPAVDGEKEGLCLSATYALTCL